MSHSSVTLSSGDDTTNVQLKFETLLDVCRKLSELPVEQLLAELLMQARGMVHAEAGTVYRVVDDSRLSFTCSQNDVRPDLCVASDSGEGSKSSGLTGLTIPIDNSSLAGYAANNHDSLKIDDVYQIAADAPYRFDGKFDESSGYRTRSMLVIPMLDQKEHTVGVLQLINHKIGEGAVDAFRVHDEQIAFSLASMAAIGVRNAQLLDELRSSHEALQRSHRDTILTLSNAAEFRDSDTGQHIRRVSMYCEMIARAHGCDVKTAELIFYASPMHDIGKLGVPDAILNKPGKLTDEERAIMQTHTTTGAKILARSDNETMRLATEIAASHHERWDGKGYPDGIAGEDIPLSGRITAVADVFDALASKRVYKPAFTVDKAVEIIKSESGKHFDPKVVEAFLTVRDDIEIIEETYRDTAD